MNTEKTDNTEIRDYLAAVEREAWALPAERRQELVADLAEHIEVTLAEQPGSARDILRRLGDPRTIAATALKESGAEASPKRGVPPLLPVLLLALAYPLVFLWAMLTPVALFAGIALLWAAKDWTVLRKCIGTLVTFVVPVTLGIVMYLVDPPNPNVQMLAAMVTLLISLAGAGWLWWARKR